MYLQGQTTECVKHMVTVWREEGGGLSEVAESYPKDPELRKWHLPARGILFHQLHKDAKQGEAKEKITRTVNNLVCIYPWLMFNIYVCFNYSWKMKQQVLGTALWCLRNVTNTSQLKLQPLFIVWKRQATIRKIDSLIF